MQWRTQGAGQVARSGYSTWGRPGTVTVRAVGVGDRLVPLGGVCLVIAAVLTARQAAAPAGATAAQTPPAPHTE